MLEDVNRAKIVITNYHAFKLRERIELSKGGRSLLQGRTGPDLDTLESEGQMLQRVMLELMSMKSIPVLHHEAHHRYRERSSRSSQNSRQRLERHTMWPRMGPGEGSLMIILSVRELWLLSNPKAMASVIRGVEQAKRGELGVFPSFRSFIGEEDTGESAATHET